MEQLSCRLKTGSQNNHQTLVLSEEGLADGLGAIFLPWLWRSLVFVISLRLSLRLGAVRDLG